MLKLCQNISRKVAETATLLAQSKADLHETLECYRCVAALLGLLKATCKSSGSSSSGEGGVRYIVEVEQWLSKAKRGLLERCRDLAAGFIRGLPADELEIGEAMLHHELDLLMPRQAGSGAAGATGNITSTGGSPDAVSARSPSGSWSGVMGDVEPAALSLRHVLVVHREAFRAAAWVSAWPEKVAVLPMVCSEHEAHVSEGAVPGLIAVRGSLRALHCAAHICKALGEPTYLGETYRTLRVPVLARMARSYSPEDSLDTREAEAAEGALDEAVREKGLCTVLEQLCARLCGAFVVEGMILMLVSQTLQATAPVPVVQATPLLSVAAGVSDDGVHGGCEKDRSGRLLQLAELQDLWCLCRDDVRALLLRNIDALKSPEDVLRVKECLLLTSEAAGEHGDVYREVPLTSMLAIVVTRFVTLQSEDLAATTTAALHAAGFLAMVVDSHEVFSSSVTALGLSKLEFEGADPFGQTGGSSWECGSSGSGLAPSSRRITANSLSPASSSMSRAGMGGRRGTFRRASRLRQAGSVSAILGSVGVGAGGKRSVRSRLGDLRSISCDAVDGEDEVGAIRVMQSVDDHFTSLSGPSVLTGEAGSGARDQNRGGGGGGGSGGGGGGGGGGAALGLMSPMTTGRRFKAINDEQTSMLDSLEDDLLRVDSSETGDDGRPESSLSNISVGSGHSGERGHGSSFDDTSSIASHSSVGTSSRRSRRTFVARKFSFSAAVPAVLKRIYISVARCFALMARVPGLAGDGEFGGRGVLTSLQQCLVAVGKALKEDLECDGADTPLVKACQISVDANALAYGLSSVRETVLQCLDEHALHHVSDEEVDAAMDPGMRVLEEVANTSKEIALELLTGKVDMLTESLCFIDWQGSSSEAGPHDVVSSVTEFLTVTMASLSQMPRPAVESIHFAVCARISRNFLEFIMAERKDAPIQVPRTTTLTLPKPKTGKSDTVT